LLFRSDGPKAAILSFSVAMVTTLSRRFWAAHERHAVPAHHGMRVFPLRERSSRLLAAQTSKIAARPITPNSVR
jgi:hypothetical protein